MIFIVIMSCFYLLLCHKPIRNILQKKRAFVHYLITHFLCLKLITDMARLPWPYLKVL